MARLTVIGSGNAFNEDGRGSAALLFESEAGTRVLVDVGPTALADWPPESSPGDLDALLITHLHGDHIAGWPFLQLRMEFVDRRQKPLSVVGPQGVASTLQALTDLCYGELSDKAGHVDWLELPVEAAADRSTAFGWSLACEPMEHHATSLGYRFEIDGVRVAVTGDTRWCPGLVRLARGADVLVMECTSVEPVGGAHICLQELRARREELDAARIVLVHTTDGVAASLGIDPLPRVEASWDGRVFELARAAAAEG